VVWDYGTRADVKKSGTKRPRGERAGGWEFKWKPKHLHGTSSDVQTDKHKTDASSQQI
jgi:hypothetical protein